MKVTGLYNSLEYFIVSTPLVAQFKASASTLNSLSRSRATNTSLVVNIPFSSLNAHYYSFFHCYFISFLINIFIGLATQVKFLINLLQQLVRPKNFLTSFTFFGSGQLNTLFTFSFSILIPLDPMMTSRNPIFCTFYTYFSGLIYKLFFSNLFDTSSTILSYPSSVFMSQTSFGP